MKLKFKNLLYIKIIKKIIKLKKNLNYYLFNKQ